MKSENYAIFGGRKDWYVLVALLIFSAYAWFAHQSELSKDVGRSYSIRVFTVPQQLFVFDQPQKNRLVIAGKIGPAEIEWDDRGRIRIASSTCSCKTCVNMGWAADCSLICVPNGIVVEVVAEQKNYDAISQ